jgi:hypothetical protein
VLEHPLSGTSKNGKRASSFLTFQKNLLIYCVVVYNNDGYFDDDDDWDNNKLYCLLIYKLTQRRKSQLYNSQ